MSVQRRVVLQRAAVLAAGLAISGTGRAQSAAAVKRPAPLGLVGLELEGSFAGWVESSVGGDLVADVVTLAAGPTGVRKKHVANFGASDIVLTVGNWMSSAFYQWLRDTLARSVPSRSGAILTFDNQLRPVGRLEFGFATLKEVGFPALDASSRDAARFTVHIAPERVRWVVPTAPPPAVSGKGRPSWLVSNFHLAVDAIDTNSVSAVDALTVTQTITRDIREGITDVVVAVPDLVITQPGAGSFGAWVEDFLVQGNTGDDRERSGSLTMLAPNLKDALFTVSFSHLGVAGSGSAGPQQAGTLVATRTQLYMEDLQLDFKPTW